MKLFTKKQYEKLIDNGTSKNSGKDHNPVVKLFLTATGCTWLLTELSADPDMPTLAFGLCDLGLGFPELGYVDIEEIRALHAPNQLRFLERDKSFSGKFPISVYARAAGLAEHIVDSHDILIRYIKK